MKHTEIGKKDDGITFISEREKNRKSRAKQQTFKTFLLE